MGTNRRWKSESNSGRNAEATCNNKGRGPKAAAAREKQKEKEAAAVYAAASVTALAAAAKAKQPIFTDDINHPGGVYKFCTVHFEEGPKAVYKTLERAEEHGPGGKFNHLCRICLKQGHFWNNCPYHLGILESEIESIVFGPCAGILCWCCRTDVRRAHPNGRTDGGMLLICATVMECSYCAYLCDHWYVDCPKRMEEAVASMGSRTRIRT